MTQDEWNRCTDPEKMLDFVKDRASDRKLRLFTCACCRQFWHLLIDPDSRHAVELGEGYADGKATREQLSAAKAAVRPVARRAYEFTNGGQSYAAAVAWRAAVGDAQWAVSKVPWGISGLASAAGPPASERAGVLQAGILRCLFGALFHPVSLAPAVLAWNDALVVRLAWAAYDERHLPEGRLDNGRLAILADALEEAGCGDADILGHLREPGLHTRGCWPVDALLGKG